MVQFKFGGSHSVLVPRTGSKHSDKAKVGEEAFYQIAFEKGEPRLQIILQRFEPDTTYKTRGKWKEIGRWATEDQAFSGKVPEKCDRKVELKNEEIRVELYCIQSDRVHVESLTLVKCDLDVDEDDEDRKLKDSDGVAQSES